MASLRENKTFQVIVGAFCVYAAWKLYRWGVVDWFLGVDDSESYGNAQLLIALGTIVVNFLQMVGVAAIGISAGILPEATKVADFISEKIKGVVATYNAGRDKDDPTFDWRPLLIVLVIWMLVSSGKLSSIVNRVIESIKQERVERDELAQAIFLLDEDATSKQQTIANSLAVDQIFQASGIERRLYYSGQSLSMAEPWAADSLDKAGLQGSKLILRDQFGGIKSLPLPSSVEQLRDLLHAG